MASSPSRSPRSARALRRVSVERGIDPRRFTMVAFGGAGPLHASMALREPRPRVRVGATSSGTVLGRRASRGGSSGRRSADRPGPTRDPQVPRGARVVPRDGTAPRCPTPRGRRPWLPLSAPGDGGLSIPWAGLRAQRAAPFDVGCGASRPSSRLRRPAPVGLRTRELRGAGGTRCAAPFCVRRAGASRAVRDPPWQRGPTGRGVDGRAARAPALANTPGSRSHSMVERR